MKQIKHTQSLQFVLDLLARQQPRPLLPQCAQQRRGGVGVRVLADFPARKKVQSLNLKMREINKQCLRMCMMIKKKKKYHKNLFKKKKKTSSQRTILPNHNSTKPFIESQSCLSSYRVNTVEIIVVDLLDESEMKWRKVEHDIRGQRIIQIFQVSSENNSFRIFFYHIRGGRQCRVIFHNLLVRFPVAGETVSCVEGLEWQ